MKSVRSFAVSIAAELLNYVVFYTGILGVGGFIAAKILSLVALITAVIGIVESIQTARQGGLRASTCFWLLVGVTLVYWSYGQVFGLRI